MRRRMIIDSIMSKIVSQTKKPHLKTQEELVGKGIAFLRGW
tara:strand:+ start:37 stop:159 length:123 start_codon:yes stop_codon:yes gene_type:complete